MAKLTMRMVRASLRNVGVTIKHDTEWGEYVVRIKDSPPDHGYHTSDLADAYQTGHAMAQETNRKRQEAVALRHRYLAQGKPALTVDEANDRAKREDEAMLGLPTGSIKA